MNPIRCEICGSSEIIKQDGIFVCQQCDCKYSADAIRKMLSHGNDTEAKQSFNVHSTSIEKYLEKARKAKEKDDWENAEKYYGMVEEISSTHTEAVFYSSYARVRASLEDTSLYKRRTAFRCLNISITTISTYFDEHYLPSDIQIVAQMSDDMMYMFAEPGEMILEKDIRFRGYWAEQRTMDRGGEELSVMYAMVATDFAKMLERIIQKHPESEKILSRFIEDMRDMAKFHQEMAEEILKENRPSGCYIATCVYGSYDCPEVWTLRRYRDETLGVTWYGRAFIRIYYAVSPKFVKCFGHTSWFKKLWKGKLDRMVESLRAKGVEDTPYKDKEW